MSNSLMHHGIKGQKYGVRRYQNADGTLTSAGKARYNVNGSGRGVGHLVSIEPNNGHAGVKGAKASVLSAAPNVKSNASTSQGVLQRMKTNRQANKYARASYKRSQALRRHDKYGMTFGLKRAERQMQIAGRNLTGAQKAGAIAKMHRDISTSYNIGAVWNAMVGGVSALNPAVTALGAPAIGAALGIGAGGAILNRRIAKDAAKKAKIAQDYADKHKNDDSDYLPERVRDVENEFYKPKLRSKHRLTSANKTQAAHSGMSAARIDINRLKGKRAADALSMALSSTITVS